MHTHDHKTSTAAAAAVTPPLSAAAAPKPPSSGAAAGTAGTKDDPRFQELTELERADPLKCVRTCAGVVVLSSSYRIVGPRRPFFDFVRGWNLSWDARPVHPKPSLSPQHILFPHNTTIPPRHPTLKPPPKSHTPPTKKHSVALLVSNDVLEHELTILKSHNPEKLDENDLAIRDAELNMKLGLLVRFYGGSVECVCCCVRVVVGSRCHPTDRSLRS